MLSFKAFKPTNITGMLFRDLRLTPLILWASVISPSGPSKKFKTCSHNGMASSELVTSVRQHAKHTHRPVSESPTSTKCFDEDANLGSNL
eukprot:scaffold27082_cov148-Skeletonema_menzelii.AAC.1